MSAGRRLAAVAAERAERGQVAASFFTLGLIGEALTLPLTAAERAELRECIETATRASSADDVE